MEGTVSFSVFFLKTVVLGSLGTSSCRPGLCRTHRGLPASASRVLGLKACATTARLGRHSLMNFEIYTSESWLLYPSGPSIFKWLQFSESFLDFTFFFTHSRWFSIILPSFCQRKLWLPLQPLPLILSCPFLAEAFHFNGGGGAMENSFLNKNFLIYLH